MPDKFQTAGAQSKRVSLAHFHPNVLTSTNRKPHLSGIRALLAKPFASSLIVIVIQYNGSL